MSMIRRAIAEFLGTFWLVFGGWALAQLWLFWLAPLIGGALDGLVYRLLAEPLPTKPAITGEPV